MAATAAIPMSQQPIAINPQPNMATFFLALIGNPFVRLRNQGKDVLERLLPVAGRTWPGPPAAMQDGRRGDGVLPPPLAGSRVRE